MCGIAGWIVPPQAVPDMRVLEAMADALAHRGPDDQGQITDSAKGVALAHRRLSILDLSQTSHQPLVDEGTGVALSFNGEIYNYSALRRELRACGHHFNSSGDTEVLLRSYLEWGLDALPRLAGMFAFAIWDPRSGLLHLARDAMGMKPLYLTRFRGGFGFASELKALLHLPGFQRDLDERGLQQYLEFGYIIETSRTILAQVQRLGPGERLSLGPTGNQEVAIREQTFWYHPPRPSSSSKGIEAISKKLGNTLEQVVAEHLVADVPVGLLLSGGLDSSLIAALAARRGELTTITMGFENSSIDERAEAEIVANHIGSNHYSCTISINEVRAEIESGAWVFDDLFADLGTISTRLLYRRCRELGLKVVLVGEGADELFGGYDVYLNLPKRLGLRALFNLYRRYAGRRYGRTFGTFLETMRGFSRDAGGDSMHAIRLFESRRQLPANYVMKVDKASMAESIEARCPYLDPRIADIAYASPLPPIQLPSQKKQLLQAIAKRSNLLPPRITRRHKFGAPLPTDWLDRDASLRRFTAEHLLQRGNLTERLGLRPAMEAYLKRGIQGEPWPLPLSIYRNLAWKLLLLELWAPLYLQPAQSR